MINLLKELGALFKWLFLEIFPQLANASFGIIGDFFDALGYVKYILLAIPVLIVVVIRVLIGKKR